MTVYVNVTGDDPGQAEQARRAVAAVLSAMGLVAHVNESSPPPPASPSTAEPDSGVSTDTPGHPLVGLSTAEVLRLREFIGKDQGAPLPLGHLTWRAANKPDEIRLFLHAMREAEAEQARKVEERVRRAAADKFSGTHGHGVFNENGPHADGLRAMRKRLLAGEVTLAEALAQYPVRTRPCPLIKDAIQGRHIAYGSHDSNPAVMWFGPFDVGRDAYEVQERFDTDPTFRDDLLRYLRAMNGEEWVADRYNDTNESARTPTEADLFPPEWIEAANPRPEDA